MAALATLYILTNINRVLFDNISDGMKSSRRKCSSTSNLARANSNGPASSHGSSSKSGNDKTKKRMLKASSSTKVSLLSRTPSLSEKPSNERIKHRDENPSSRTSKVSLLSETSRDGSPKPPAENTRKKTRENVSHKGTRIREIKSNTGTSNGKPREKSSERLRAKSSERSRANSSDRSRASPSDRSRGSPSDSSRDSSRGNITPANFNARAKLNVSSRDNLRGSSRASPQDNARDTQRPRSSKATKSVGKIPNCYRIKDTISPTKYKMYGPTTQNTRRRSTLPNPYKELDKYLQTCIESRGSLNASKPESPSADSNARVVDADAMEDDEEEDREIKVRSISEQLQRRHLNDMVDLSARVAPNKLVTELRNKGYFDYSESYNKCTRTTATNDNMKQGMKKPMERLYYLIGTKPIPRVASLTQFESFPPI